MSCDSGGGSDGALSSCLPLSCLDSSEPQSAKANAKRNIIWMLPAWRAAALLDTHMPTLTMLYLMCTWIYLCGFEALLCWWVITLVELCGPAEVMLCTFMIQADSISACVGLFLNVFKLVYACSSTLSRYITKGVFTRYDVNLVLYIFTMKSKPQMASLLWHQRANQNALKS